MDSRENSRPTGIKPPSKLPALSTSTFGRGLQELTAADNNARAMPPPVVPAKHKATGLPEPTPLGKRKTLAEQAGEVKPRIPAPPSVKPVNGAIKATTAAGIRNGNYSSSVTAASTRPTRANSTRANSNTSFASSYNQGGRPQRPQTSMAHTRSMSHQTPSNRPQTALDTADSDPPSLGKRKAWDTKGRLEDMEALYGELRQQMQSTTTERENMKENIEIYKAKINELDCMRVQLSTKVDSYRSQLEDTRLKLTQSEIALDAAKKTHAFELKDIQRQSEHELKDLQFKHEREMTRLKLDSEREAEELQRKLDSQTNDLKKEYEQNYANLKKEMEAELEKERQLRVKEVSEMRTETELHRQNAGVDLERKEREMKELKRENEQLQADIERKTALEKNLRDKLSEASANIMTLESSNSAMKAKINFLESDSQAQSSAFGELQKQMQEAIDAAEEAKAKLRAEETLRRKLHNQVQELKGNIRVFCRVRPPSEVELKQAAEIAYPDAGKDSKEVVIQGPEQKSAMGTVSRSTNPFTFDRVFGPGSQNAEVFEEISQLVQSALDGYNVCIFCYGQTGSGKTFTMSSVDGMIPRAVQQIYTTAQTLEEKGWKYKMEGQFVEVYNENLNDLLGKAEELDKKKLEIRHDPAKKQTTITDVTTVALDSPDRVQEMLSSASRNRSVAATMANSRSSRSHSVFILKLKGENSITGERSEGTLNLVDLAGSERLSHSGATGDRLKETQNINRSLSCLGDVIGALGSGKEGTHVPYRNSKLTYLLQYSLGGNSKTLMFVMISPLQPHLHETLTSLKFATKVHNTHIGTAKRQAKVKD
ncbi:kinesin motor domain-containing protein [Macrophomina phaseolina]|uniref:Kinesin-like protein n=1 Tax=Macrophomina phaseolina TaxID=35725 RepID=A0ABQ8GN00_9PEZI|nr:kinesin motor domain-containing protein [Macrophomina phaseolina]